MTLTLVGMYDTIALYVRQAGRLVERIEAARASRDRSLVDSLENDLIGAVANAAIEAEKYRQKKRGGA